MEEAKQLNKEEKKEEKKQENKKTDRDIIKWILIGILIFVVAVLIFGVGMFVGEKKEEFSCHWAENYHKNFAGPRGGFSKDWRKIPPAPGDFIETHGIFGEIIGIKGDEFVIKGKDNLEKVILVTDKTIIQKNKEEVKKEELKVDNFVVVIGSPNEDGKIEAKLIRVFSEEPEMPPASVRPQRFSPF